MQLSWQKQEVGTRTFKAGARKTGSLIAIGEEASVQQDTATQPRRDAVSRSDVWPRQCRGNWGQLGLEKLLQEVNFKHQKLGADHARVYFLHWQSLGPADAS